MIALNRKRKIAFICSFLPRKCGIATFTSDLINNADLAANGEFEPSVIAMQSETELKYDPPVKFRIRKNIKYDYTAAADYINYSNIESVSIQHEFGLFGGPAGTYLNLLLERLRKPVTTTLHTVLNEPNEQYLDSLINVCRLSDQIIVMNKRGIEMLQNIYSVSPSKIKLIPHGIPDMPFASSYLYKRKLGLTDRKIILTFGLLSKNKGIEIMLRAMPRIIENDPSALYIVLGATHPEVLRYEGQAYKLGLQKMVKDLGLYQNVIFINRFVSDHELTRYLGAADIYVSPYLNKEQLTSGTLAFAVGAGKAVVSTGYWAAQELLAQDRGKLVGFGDPEDMAQKILQILNNKSLSFEMRKRAYQYGRSMTWKKVGLRYWQLFKNQISSMPIPLTTNQYKKISSHNQLGGLTPQKPKKTKDQQLYQSA